MKMIGVFNSCCVLLALFPDVGYPDNPAPHLNDRTEVLFNPADEAKAMRLLEKAGLHYEVNTDLPGTPIVHVALGDRPTICYWRPWSGYLV
jgi:hypothetical protein